MAETTSQFESWRGVAAENADSIARPGALYLRDRSKRLLWSLLRPFARVIPLLVIVILVENVARLSIPTLVEWAMDLGVPPIARGEGSSILTAVIGAMVAVIVIQAVSRVWFLRTSGRIGQDVVLELRRRVFRKFQRLDVAFHDRYTSGRVVSRSTSDIDSIQEMLLSGIDGLISALLTLIGVGVLLLVKDWRLGLVCLLSFPLLAILFRWFQTQSTVAWRRTREMTAVLIVQFVETMTGIRAVQAYRREPRNQAIYGEVTGTFAVAWMRNIFLNAIFGPGVRIIGAVTTAVALVVGGLFVMDGSMTVGVLTAFLLYLRMFFQPIGELSQFYNTLQSALSGLEKLSGVLEEEETVAAPAEPTPMPHSDGAMTLDGVRFSYVEDVPVLRGLDIGIPAGQTVALVGTTGAGKTTIAKLMCRFHDPDTGTVSLDGVDLRRLDDDTLRRHVVMVTQENFMFAGSIADNIAFGRPAASRSEIEAAGAAVGLDHVVGGLPDGYDTDVGKRGARLSAGQRQLVAFARAFLADPAVLILDEATSSLDVPSERLVQRGLQTILADRTAVIIAHRLSTVEIADRVLVLEHGQVVEDGSPAELMATDGGRYATLHDAWIESLAQ